LLVEGRWSRWVGDGPGACWLIRKAAAGRMQRRLDRRTAMSVSLALLLRSWSVLRRDLGLHGCVLLYPE
jgi:hypothetical protein